MIALALALATPAPPELSDDTAIAEEPAYEDDAIAVAEEPYPSATGLSRERLDAIKRAIAKAEAERIAENEARALPSFSIQLSPMPTPSNASPPAFSPGTRGPVLDFDPVQVDRRHQQAANRPAVDTRITPEERLAQLLPIAWALAGAALAFGLWRFMRPRWRGYAAVARTIIAGYWREIGLFGMLSAIFLKLW